MRGCAPTERWTGPSDKMFLKTSVTPFAFENLPLGVQNLVGAKPFFRKEAEMGAERR